MMHTSSTEWVHNKTKIKFLHRCFYNSVELGNISH
eukprot:UN05301